MNNTLILAFALTIITTFSGKNLNAQTTKEEAGNAFNAALELSKTDMAGAVVKMQDVLKMCTAVGADADSLKMKVAIVLPVYQYNVGNTMLKDKNYEQAITAFEKSLEFSTIYKDDNIKEKSEGQLVRLYTNKGNILLKADKADSALIFLDKALKFDPEYTKALFTEGQAYKKKGDNVKMQENMDKVVVLSSKTNDTTTIKAARNTIALSLYQEGKTAFTKKSYSEAVTKLNAALGYEYKNKELYYLLASSNNSLKNFDAAIDAANLGLAMEEQTNEKMARFYYEIAKSYEGKKDIANACASYKKSAFGTFASSANYQIKTVLKCQ
jgi:tetratricopeptide (TPR) repeat protein